MEKIIIATRFMSLKWKQTNITLWHSRGNLTRDISIWFNQNNCNKEWTKPCLPLRFVMTLLVLPGTLLGEPRRQRWNPHTAFLCILRLERHSQHKLRMPFSSPWITVLEYAVNTNRWSKTLPTKNSISCIFAPTPHAHPLKKLWVLSWLKYYVLHFPLMRSLLF